jgi:ankyrin repeat protein
MMLLLEAQVHGSGRILNKHIDLLSSAIKKERFAMAEAMLRAGADPTIYNSAGSTPLGGICLSCDDQTAAMLARAVPVVAPKASFGGYLHTSIKLSKLMLLREIVSRGADLDIYDGEGVFALMRACKHEFAVEMVRTMVSGNINLEYTDPEGRTALLYADKAEVVQILLDAGADAMVVDKEGRTVLMEAESDICEAVLRHIKTKYNIPDYVDEEADTESAGTDSWCDDACGLADAENKETI